jgi:hypothetical protein
LVSQRILLKLVTRIASHMIVAFELENHPRTEMLMRRPSRLFLLATAAALLSASLPAQTNAVRVPGRVLESYVGQYDLAPGFVLTIRKEGDQLTAQATGQPRVRLTPKSETDFEVRSIDASLTFVKDADGKVTQLVLHQNGEHEARKVSSDVPKERVAIKLDSRLFDAYVGQYELETGGNLTIRRDGDKLRAQLADQPSFQIFAESETNFFYKVVDAQLTFTKDPVGKVTGLVLHQNGDKSARKTADTVPPLKTVDLTRIPPRDPKADSRLIDLTGKYNALLTEQWHPDAEGLPSGVNHLGAVPKGVQKLGGTDFDVRGVIQLTGTQAEFAGAAFPEAQIGIKLGRKCQRLHFLQSAGWTAEDGTPIAKYVLHYAGGEQAVLNIVYGADVRDWWAAPGDAKELKSATVAWSGSNAATEAAGRSLRLYKRTYANPKPNLQIETLDFISTQADAAPFLIAITVED